MRVKFNPTGTSVGQDGKLNVRVDCIPDIGDKTYAKNYLYLPTVPVVGYPGKVDEFGFIVDQIAYDKWVASLPHAWQITPCLSHFIQVPETCVNLDEYIAHVFDPVTVATLDYVLTLPDAIHYVSPLMRAKKIPSEPVKTKDYVGLVATINQRFVLSSVVLLTKGVAEIIEPQTIDIGDAAVTGSEYPALYTFFTEMNPANADGTIDTYTIYAMANITGLKVGTGYSAGGNDYTCRASASVGDALAGAREFSGLSIAVSTGDFAGGYFATGRGAYNTSGNHASYNADSLNASETQTYTPGSLRISLYGTGTEGGAGLAIPIAMHHYRQMKIG